MKTYPTLKQSGAVEACLAHNQEVNGSNHSLLYLVLAQLVEHGIVVVRA